MYQFLTLYFRNIRNNPKMFLINIASFSVGIVAVLFITLFVAKEFYADRFHKKHSDIYRLLLNVQSALIKYPETEYPLAKLLQNNHPEIQDYTRFTDLEGYQITIDEKQFVDQKISYVDRSFFSIFDFKLKVGNLNSMFEQPNTIVIDQATAKLYFNSIDVVGKTLTSEYPGEEEKKEYTIVGVLKNYPEESTLQPHLITSIKSIAEKYEENYFSSSPQLFLYVPKCSDTKKLARDFSATFNRKYNELTGRNEPVDENRYSLQQLTDIYLKSSDVSDDLPKGDYLLIWVLSGIGFVLLLVTFMNYLILNLGVNLRNQKQNQIRTILGSSSGWLKMKYASESVFYSLITFVVALLLLPIVHKFIANFSNYRYSIFSGSDPKIVFIFLLFLITVGALCGYLQYALLFQRKNRNIQLAGFKTRKPYFRYIIQFQLLIFMVIVSGVILINRQMNFIRNQNLGFDLKNTVTVCLNDEFNRQLFMQECNNYPMVKNASLGHTLFTNTAYLNEVTIEKRQDVVKAQCIWGDNNYISTYNIKLLSGKNIDGAKLPPVGSAYSYPRDNDVLDILVNEEFVKKSGLKDPLGTILSINHNGTKGRITGIIADVKNTPFYKSVTPLIIGYGMSYMPSIVVSVYDGKMDEFEKMVDDYFIKIGKKSYVGYSTFNFDFERWYHKEQVLMHLLTLLTIIILVILILGIYGSSLFLSENKTKEIGIRKINGAKVTEVMTMLNIDFIKWVAIAFVIATPIAYYAMNKWLENFAYKTELSWWIFALAGLLALGIALLTVSWQSWRAATRNPVEALRYE
jgi:putative ABC transport system permease protein